MYEHLLCVNVRVKVQFFLTYRQNLENILILLLMRSNKHHKQLIFTQNGSG